MKKYCLFVIFMLLSQMAHAVNVEIDSICYSINLKTGETVVVSNSNHAYVNDIVIPETITYEGVQYQVSAIGDRAFFCCDRVSSIALPQSIRSIGQAAFYQCHLLDSVFIPEQVKIIETDVFAGCKNLSCVVMPDGITSIGNSAFNACQRLDSLVLPKMLETIEDWAFAGCSQLSYVVIPPSLSYVGQGAFGNCYSLQDVQIPDLSSWCKIKFKNNTANPLALSHKLVINDEEITDLAIPEDVTAIGSYAFWGCSNIESVTIGEQVSNIGDWAFGACTKISSVTCFSRKVPGSSNLFDKKTIENAVLYVAASVFTDYSNAEPWNFFKEILKIEFPKHVLSYYVDGVLYKTYTMEEGEYITPEPVPTKEGYTFSGWSDIPKVMPKHDVSITGTFTLTSIQLLSGGIQYTLWVMPKTAEISGIALNDVKASSGCLNIPTTVSNDGIEYAVTRIADSAFAAYDSLVSVTIPESITSIGKEAFNGCMLQNVSVRNVMADIDDSAFSPATYNHAMLYIPTGKWMDAVYKGCLWRFMNIRETATEARELSPQKAYTLMNVNSFGYLVYDAVNEEMKTIHSYYDVEETSPYNSWQIVHENGVYSLYNIGAKKYAKLNPKGEFVLTDQPAALNMKDGLKGIILGDDAQMQWNFVQNDKIKVDESVLGIETLMGGKNDTPATYHRLDGTRTNGSQQGIVIMKFKDGRTVKRLNR